MDKPKDRRKDGQKDEQTQFYRTLLDKAGGPIRPLLTTIEKKFQI